MLNTGKDKKQRQVVICRLVSLKGSYINDHFLNDDGDFFPAIDLSTVVCLVAWPLNESEAGVTLF